MRALLALGPYTPMGRERALALEPSTDLGTIHAALGDTRQGRLALAAAGPPPWDVIPDVRPTLDRARTPGAVVDGVDLRGLLPLLEAAGDSRLRRSIERGPDPQPGSSGCPRGLRRCCTGLR